MVGDIVGVQTVSGSGNIELTGIGSFVGGLNMASGAMIGTDRGLTFTNDENTITFMIQDQALLSGTFNVSDFNENSISLTQQVEETIGDITSLINMNISLERI